MAKVPAGKARKAAKRERKAAEAQSPSAAGDSAPAKQVQAAVKPHRKRPQRSDDEEEPAPAVVVQPKVKRSRTAGSPVTAAAAAAAPRAAASRALVIPPIAAGAAAADHNKASRGFTAPAVASPAAPYIPSEGGAHELFVKFLPRDCDEAEAEKMFSACGALAKPISLLRDFNTGQPKGACFVTFQTAEGAAEALKFNGHSMRGRHLEVTVAVCRRERPGLKGQQQELGTHTPALFYEVLNLVVAPDPDGVFVDATFGRGGHSRGILSALSPAGRLHGLDMDPHAVEVGNELSASDSRFTMHSTVFSDMRKALPKELRGRLAGALFDLGISSPQLDDPNRGMRPEQSGPLDLRYDIGSGEPAWKLLETLPRNELAAILARYGDGQDSASAERVADAIALAKLSGEGVPRTTVAFATLVAACRIGGDYQRMHAAKLTFQALRMAINAERRQMMNGMRAAFKLLKPGGVIAVITWKHSEAALVTEFLRENELAPPSFPLRQWWEEPSRGHPPLPRVAGLRRAPAVCPSEAELRGNSRSRSAVLHILQKEEGIRVADVQSAVYEKLGWEALSVPSLHAV